MLILQACIDSKKFFSGSSSGIIKMWRIDGGELIFNLTGHIQPITNLYLNSNLISLSEDEIIKIWDIQLGQFLKTVVGKSEWVLCSIFLTNTNEIIIGSYEANLIIWNLTNEIPTIFQGHVGGISSILFLSRTNEIVTGYFDKNIKIWNKLNGNCERTLVGHTSIVTNLVFLPDLNELISVAGECFKNNGASIFIWNLKTGVCMKTLYGHKCGIFNLILDSFNGELITCSTDSTIRFWSLYSNKTSYILKEHRDGIKCMI